MKTETVHLGAIFVSERLRGLDPDWAAMVAESMRDRGLDTPIVVRAADAQGRHQLVAGLHRLEGAKILGWEAIEARIFEGDDLSAELAEIDENLMRRELSELDRATFLARRQEVWQALHPHTSKRGRKVAKLGDNSQPIECRFSKAASKKLGLSERTIDRAIGRFKALAPDVRARLGTHPIADKGAQIDLLAGLTPTQQRKVADCLLREMKPVRSVAEAMAEVGIPRPTNGPASPDGPGAVARLVKLYRELTPVEQRHFLEAVGATVIAA